MKITNVNTKLFLESLEIVGNAIPNKTPMPTLIGVLMKFYEDRITFLGSDGNTAIRNVLFENENNNYNLDNEFECLVDYKMLKTLMSKLYSPTSNFYLKSNQFVIENGKSVYKLNLIDLINYPKIEFKRLENEIKIKTEELKNIINKTAFACASDMKKPILTGVNFIGKDKELKCIASDGFRLSQYKIELEEEVQEFNFTFPKQSMISLLKIIEKTKNDTVNLLYNNSNEILLRVDNTLYKTILLDGTYPNVSKIVSTFYENKCLINKNLLIEAIDRVGVLGKDLENNLIVKLIFNQQEKSLTVTSGCNLYGNAHDYIDCDFCNFGLEVISNGNYFIEALKTFDNDNVSISLISNVRPIIIKKENDDKLIQVCLPVKAN